MVPRVIRMLVKAFRVNMKKIPPPHPKNGNPHIPSLLDTRTLREKDDIEPDLISTKCLTEGKIGDFLGENDELVRSAEDCTVWYELKLNW